MTFSSTRILAFTAAALLLAALLLSGCNKGGKSAGNAAPGAVPQPSRSAVAGATISEDLYKQLPLDPAWEVKSFSEDDTAYFISAQSSSGAMETAGYLLKWLNDNGYDNADNPSRIMEGTEFGGGNKRFKRIFAKASLDADSNCIVELTAYK
ncbi:hypothetical protein IT575_02955 [bacterium]|nr:hypothetical protein [bacterium]